MRDQRFYFNYNTERLSVSVTRKFYYLDLTRSKIRNWSDSETLAFNGSFQNLTINNKISCTKAICTWAVWVQKTLTNVDHEMSDQTCVSTQVWSGISLFIDINIE